jgi:hypothetical protein
MYGVSNPYGAVPQSLKDMSETILAITRGNLEGKKLDQDLSLAKAKTEAERTLIEAGMEKDRLHNLQTIAQHEQAKEAQRQANIIATGHLKLGQDAQIHEFGPKFELHKKETEARLKNLSLSNAALADQMQKKSIRDWVAQTNIDPRIVAASGYNLDSVVTKADAKDLFGKAEGLVPHLGLALAHKDIGDIESKMKTATPEEMPRLEAAYNDTMNKAAVYKLRVSAAGQWSPTEKAKLIGKFMDNGDTIEAATEKAQGIESVMQKTKLSGDYLNSSAVSFDHLVKKNKVHHFYDQYVDEAAQTIQASAPEKLQQSILAGYKQRIQKGDYQDAFGYIRGHAQQLQLKKNAPATAQSEYMDMPITME